MSRPLVDERVMEFIRVLADESGYRIVEVTTRGGASFFMEIVLDKEGGITLGECGDFNRKITAWMDKENIAGWHYTIDVCSPGLDKELRTDSAFSWAVGKEVMVTLREPVNGRTSHTGKLVRFDGASVVLVGVDDGKEITFDRSNIVRTKLRIVL